MRNAHWIAILLAVVCVSCVLAESRSGMSAEEQKKKVDELMQSAKESQSIAVLAVQVGAVFIGVALLWGAYSTATNGLVISKEKRIEGTPARILAAFLAMAAIGLAIAGVLYAPSLGL